MSIQLGCPHCKSRMTVADKFGGKPVHCPQCKMVFTVPFPSAIVLDKPPSLPSKAEPAARKRLASMAFCAFALLVLACWLVLRARPGASDVGHEQEPLLPVAARIPVQEGKVPVAAQNEKKEALAQQPKKTVWKSGAAEIEVKYAEIKKISIIDEINGMQISSTEECLRIVISIDNVSATGLVSFDGWGATEFGSKPKLKDNFGNYYRTVSFGFGKKVVGRARKVNDVRPRDSCADVLVFIAPIKNAKSFTLILPGRNIGSEDDIELEIPGWQVAGLSEMSGR